jgi:hypothetical protein
LVLNTGDGSLCSPIDGVVDGSTYSGELGLSSEAHGRVEEGKVASSILLIGQVGEVIEGEGELTPKVVMGFNEVVVELIGSYIY